MKPALGDVVEVTWNDNALPGPRKTIQVWDDACEINKHCFDKILVIIRNGQHVGEVVET